MFYPLTTDLCDTNCVDPGDYVDLVVMTKDIYGNYSLSAPAAPIILQAGNLDYCGSPGGWLEKRDAQAQGVGTSLREFGLGDNYPNPFNAATVLSFTLAETERWSLDVIDILGRTVRSFDGTSPSGTVRIEFDGRDKSGTELASGVYFWRVTTPSASGVRKMAIVK